MSGTKMMEMIEWVAKGDDAVVVVRESVEGGSVEIKNPPVCYAGRFLTTWFPGSLSAQKGS